MTKIQSTIYGRPDKEGRLSYEEERLHMFVEQLLERTVAPTDMFPILLDIQLDPASQQILDIRCWQGSERTNLLDMEKT